LSRSTTTPPNSRSSLSKDFRTIPHDFVAEGDKVVVLTTRELGGGATEGADVLTFNADGKLVTFEALGDADRPGVREVANVVKTESRSLERLSAFRDRREPRAVSRCAASALRADGGGTVLATTSCGRQGKHGARYRIEARSWPSCGGACWAQARTSSEVL
jgi:hypothetical protein